MCVCVGGGRLDFTSPLSSRIRGIVVESAAALSRSALRTLGSGYCVARWGRPDTHQHRAMDLRVQHVCVSNINAKSTTCTTILLRLTLKLSEPDQYISKPISPDIRYFSIETAVDYMYI